MAPEAVSAALARWAGRVRTSALFEAVAIAGAMQDDMFHLVLKILQDRVVALEQQNEVLEGGRHRKEVDAAEAKTEARLRGEFEAKEARLQDKFAAREAALRDEFAATEAALRNQLTEEQQRCKDVDAQRRRRLEEVRASVDALIQAGA